MSSVVLFHVLPDGLHGPSLPEPDRSCRACSLPLETASAIVASSVSDTCVLTPSKHQQGP